MKEEKLVEMKVSTRVRKVGSTRQGKTFVSNNVIQQIKDLEASSLESKKVKK